MAALRSVKYIRDKAYSISSILTWFLGSSLCWSQKVHLNFTMMPFMPESILNHEPRMCFVHIRYCVDALFPLFLIVCISQLHVQTHAQTHTALSRGHLSSVSSTFSSPSRLHHPFQSEDSSLVSFSHNQNSNGSTNVVFKAIYSWKTLSESANHVYSVLFTSHNKVWILNQSNYSSLSSPYQLPIGRVFWNRMTRLVLLMKSISDVYEKRKKKK